MHKKNFHSTAIIDLGATIGNETSIWHWSHICSQTIIGNNCNIGQNVFIADNVIIGDNCKIQNNVSLYEGITFEDYVFCGPSVVFTNVVNPRSQINRKKDYKKTIVKEGSSLGANATILCGITIEKYSFVGAGSVLTKNTKPYGLYTGVPGRHVGWISKEGFKLSLPLEGDGKTKCKNSGQEYILENGFCYCKSD
jgi:UDP-2-acetamido-3-amino-2,3-dideoxy-glucuronate N-acetyltransferase